jgi:hypothetical protein
MFGSDNPINGPDTYDDPLFYQRYFDGMQADLSKEAYEGFMFRNAIQLFKLKQFASI